MCGITAYIGGREAFPILIQGLERLEYRGYDSAGIATFDAGEIHMNKAVGKVVNLKYKELPGKIGIAHTRWATHGPPTEANAHPHHNDEQSISLVHNGIIENYASIRKKLEAEGYKFYSQTDTEVLTKAIDYFFKKNGESDFKKALTDALHEVVGAYGLVILNKKENKIYAARKGSPLCLGIGKEEFFISSDPAAFLEYTRRVLYLEDEDVLVVDPYSYQIHNLHQGHQDCEKRDITNIDWDLNNMEKNGYEHFMLKEIYEQPESLKNCIAGRNNLDHAVDELKGKISEDFIKSLNRIVFAACGTSWHAAQLAKRVIEKYCRVPVEVDHASEFRYKKPIISSKDLFVVISQSGETADTLAALKEAKSSGAKTFGFVNVVGSSIARGVDAGTYIRAGPEIGVASTKAFTAQVLSLLNFSFTLGYIRGALSKEEAQKYLESLEDVPELVRECFNQEDQVKRVAKEFKDAKSCFFLGRGINVPTALEGSLKMKEISYIHSEAFPAAEMKHGPIALLEPDFPVVTIIPKNDPIYEKILSNVQEVKARGAKVIALIQDNDHEAEHFADFILTAPEVPDYLQAIIFSIPLQLLAYYTALERGCEIDQPRNLAKSVTVE